MAHCNNLVRDWRGELSKSGWGERAHILNTKGVPHVLRWWCWLWDKRNVYTGDRSPRLSACCIAEQSGDIGKALLIHFEGVARFAVVYPQVEEVAHEADGNDRIWLGLTGRNLRQEGFDIGALVPCLVEWVTAHINGVLHNMIKLGFWPIASHLIRA